MGFILWLIIGGIAGWIAGKVMRGGGFGILGNIVVGIVGAVIGGFLFSLPGAVLERADRVPGRGDHRCDHPVVDRRQGEESLDGFHTGWPRRESRALRGFLGSG